MNEDLKKDAVMGVIGSWLPIGLLTATTWFDVTGLETITVIYYSLIIALVIFAVSIIPAMDKEQLNEYRKAITKKPKWKYYLGVGLTAFQVVTFFVFQWYTIGVLMLILSIIMYYHVSEAFAKREFIT